MLHDIKKIYRSFRYGFHGIAHAYRNDRSFSLEVNWGLPTYLVLGYLLMPLSPAELLLFIGSYLLILIVELVNTAYETMLARIHPEHHEVIGRGKDISAASVAVAFMFAALVVIVLGFEHFKFFDIYHA